MENLDSQEASILEGKSLMQFHNGIPNKERETTTFKFSPRPLPFLAFNWLENIFSIWGKSILNLSEERLMKTAIRKTGLSDWGDDSFIEPLGILLESFREEAKLDLYGKYLIYVKVLGLLCNRLCIQDELKRHPEISDKKIKKPLFIISLPRTGTTMLHNLMALDSNNRCLTHWEAMAPSLHPKAAAENRDSRIKVSKRSIRLMERYTPDLLKVHPMNAEGPEECHFLFGHSFICSETFTVLANLPNYNVWADKQDKIPAYRYYRQMLQLLQSHRSGDHWVLKSPDHMKRLDALLDVFPDANLVQIHRDPLKVLPSNCSLISISRGICSKQVDLHAIGNYCIQESKKYFEQDKMVRNSIDPAQLCDLNYKDLVADPVGAVRGIYNYFGYHYDKQMDDHIKKWLKENRKHKKGVHRYSLEQFGLNPDIVYPKFKEYIDQFNIVKE